MWERAEERKNSIKILDAFIGSFSLEKISEIKFSC